MKRKVFDFLLQSPDRICVRFLFLPAAIAVRSSNGPIFVVVVVGGGGGEMYF